MRDKHYPADEAEDLARKIFDNVDQDKGRGNRSAEYFLDKIVTREEWISQLREIVK